MSNELEDLAKYNAETASIRRVIPKSEPPNKMLDGLLYALGASPVLILVGVIIYMLIEGIWRARLDEAFRR